MNTILALALFALPAWERDQPVKVPVFKTDTVQVQQTTVKTVAVKKCMVKKAKRHVKCS